MTQHRASSTGSAQCFKQEDVISQCRQTNHPGLFQLLSKESQRAIKALTAFSDARRDVPRGAWFSQGKWSELSENQTP